jgi:hypothetical protein
VQDSHISALFNAHASDSSGLSKRFAKTKIRLVNDGKAERFTVAEEYVDAHGEEK